MRENKEQGFTLIELILTLALSLLVLTGFMTVFWTSMQAYEWGTSSTDIQYMARRAINDIKMDIKEAGHISINPENTEITLNPNTNEEVRYYINNGDLIRASNKASTPIAESLNKLKFNQSDTGLVEILVSVEANDREYKLITSISPRNSKL